VHRFASLEVVKEENNKRESQTRTIEDVNIPNGDECTANKISNELNLREKGSNVMLLNLYLQRSALFFLNPTWHITTCRHTFCIAGKRRV
jgi:hypothetical protein